MKEIISNSFNININKEVEQPPLTKKEIISNSFSVNINKQLIIPNNPPSITNVRVLNTDVLGNFELQFDLIDTDNDKLDVFLKIGSNDYKTILANQESGTIKYKGTNMPSGTNICRLKVSDGKSIAFSKEFEIIIPQMVNDDIFESIELITDKNIKGGEYARVAIRLKSKATINNIKLNPKLLLPQGSVIKNAQWEKGTVMTDYRQSVSEISSKTSELSVNLDGIKGSVEKIEGDYVTQSELKLTSEKLEFKVSQSGGYNLIYNGNFKRDIANWSVISGNYNFIQDSSCTENQTAVRFNGSLATTHCLRQYFTMNSTEPFTVSFWYYTSSDGADGSTNPYRTMEVTVIYSDDTRTYHSAGQQTTFNKWEKKTITINPTKKIKDASVSIYCRDTTKTVYYTNIMVEKGILATAYSPNPNEIYDGVTTIDKDGVTVTASNVKSKTNMSANGFKITKTDTNEDVFKVNSDGTLYMKGSVTVTSGNAKDMVDRVVGWTYSGTTEINGGNIRTGTLSASKITAGTLDASRVNVTNLNASNIKSGKLSADYIDATNLSVKGELLSGQINGVDGMKFADGAVISSCVSGVAGHKGIQISAPVIKLGDKVEINRPTIFYDVTGKNDSSSKTTTWTMSSAGALTCASASLSGTLNVKNGVIYGMNNLALARGSIYIPSFGTSYTYDFIRGGNSSIAFADSGPIHFIYNGTRSSFVAGGTVYLPHAGNVNCDHFRLGSGIMACPSSGSFHFLTASGNTSPLYAGRLYSADVLYLNEPMTMANNSVFDKINSINVIETKNGLILHNPISNINVIDESPEVVKTVYNEEKDEIKTSIDYTSAISTLWKAVQELKQENDELKEKIKDIYSKL